MRVVVSSDATQAELIIPGELEGDSLSLDLARAAAMETGVPILDHHEQDILDAIEQARAGNGEAVRRVFASATPPVDATDGRVEWTVAEPDLQAMFEESDSEAVDYREVSAFVMVKAGDEIGRLIAPSRSEDGVDVRGNAIAAREGRPAAISLDATIEARDDGTLVAAQDGALVRTPTTATIQDHLRIDESVDYSTGNVKFEGSVHIRKCVKDRFEVHAAGDVTIEGLVEMATINAGGNLHLKGGMTGREHGAVSARGELAARFLDSLSAEAFGTFTLAKEAISCVIAAHADLNAPSAAIIGGELSVGGVGTVGTLGSEAGVHTLVRLGDAPRLRTRLARLDEIVEALEEALRPKRKEFSKLSEPGRTLAVKEMERQMELNMELSGAEQKLSRATEAREAARATMAEHRTADLTINRLLCQGVVFRFDEREFHVRDDERGPITIYLDVNTRPVFRRGDGPANSITAIADPKAIPEHP